MKKFFISILALTSIFFTACENNSNSKKEFKNEIEKNNENLESEKIDNIEVLEIKSESEVSKKEIKKVERIKSQKEINFPERFNPVTGESIVE